MLEINSAWKIPYLRKLGFWDKLSNRSMGKAIAKAILLNGGRLKSDKQVYSIFALLGLFDLCSNYSNPVYGYVYILPKENYRKFNLDLLAILNEWNDPTL